MNLPCRQVAGGRILFSLKPRCSSNLVSRDAVPSVVAATAPAHRAISSSSIPRQQQFGSDQANGDPSSSSSSFPYTFPSHLPNPSPYDILQISKTATSSEIKARYYDLVKRLHPDRQRSVGVVDSSSTDNTADAKGKGKGKGKAVSSDQGSNDNSNSTSSSSSAEQFHQVVKAYELLSNTTKRKAFDRYGFGWTPSSSSSSASAASQGGYGTFGYATRQEWDELQRRRAFSFSSSSPYGPRPGPTSAEWWTAHDQTGWQRHAAASAAADDAAFFASRQRYAGPQYGSNSRFISIVALVTWTLALVQFNRIADKSEKAARIASDKQREAAHSYQEVRGRAQSLEGRRRFENLRVRAREQKVLEQVEAQRELAGTTPTTTPVVHALPPPPPPPPEPPRHNIQS